MSPRKQEFGILNGFLELSVRVGKLYVPGASVQQFLGKYCVNLFVWTHDDIHKIQLVGTASPLLFRGHYLLVSSSHQLRDVCLQDVCLLYPDGSSAVTNSGVRAFNLNGTNLETDAFDIAAFEFTEPIREHPTLIRSFFDFSALPPDINSDNILSFVISGYPSSKQRYELEERNHLGTVKSNLIALPDGQPEDYSLLRAKFVEPLDFDPDGLSGAPVFAIIKEGDSTAAYFAGIVLRAGKEYLHFLKAGFVKEFLESTVLGAK